MRDIIEEAIGYLGQLVEESLREPDLRILNYDFVKVGKNADVRVERVRGFVDRAVENGGLIKSNMKELNDWVNRVHNTFSTNLSIAMYEDFTDYFRKAGIDPRRFDGNYSEFDAVIMSEESINNKKISIIHEISFNSMSGPTHHEVFDFVTSKYEKNLREATEFYRNIDRYVNYSGFKKINQEYRIKDIIAIWRKYEPIIMGYLRDFGSLYEFLKELKNNVITKESKAGAERKQREEIMRRPMTRENVAKLEKMLTEIVSKFRADIEENYKERVQEILRDYEEYRIDEFESARDADIRLGTYDRTTGSGRFSNVGYYIKHTSSRDGKAVYEVDLSNLDKYAKNYSENTVNIYRDKNIGKLYMILDAKGTEIEKIESHAVMGRGTIEGALKFIFVDGTKFTVSSQVVYSSHPRGYGDVVRFPTTFHDIQMPDGSFHKRESEAWMIKNFK